MAQPSFTHLRTHSSYSVGQGLMSPTQVVAAAVAHGMTAVGLTDTGTIAGLPEFIDAACRAGIKPIPGIQLPVETWSKDGMEPLRGEAVFIALDRDGLLSLVRMHNMAMDNHGAVDLDRLETNDTVSLLMLTGGRRGILMQAISFGEWRASQLIEDLSELFPGRLAIELQRMGDIQGEPWMDEVRLGSIAAAQGLPIVATNDVYFAKPDHHHSHVLLTQLHTPMRGAERVSMAGPQHWFAAADSMRDLFADLPDACDNADIMVSRVQISQSDMEAFRPKRLRIDHLRTQAAHRLSTHVSGRSEGDQARYVVRLNEELDAMERAGQSARFAIVDAVGTGARSIGALMGPGVGSLAGSLLASVLGEGAMDPVAAGLSADRHFSLGESADCSLEVEASKYDALVDFLRREDAASLTRLTYYQTLGSLGLVMQIARVLLGGSDQDHERRIGPERISKARAVLGYGSYGLILKNTDELVALLGEDLRPAVLAAGRMEQHQFYVGSYTSMPNVLVSGGDLSPHLPLRGGDVPSIAFNKAAIRLIGIPVVALTRLDELDEASRLCAVPTPSRIRFDLIPEDDGEVWSLIGSGIGGLMGFNVDDRPQHLTRLRPQSVLDLAALNALYWSMRPEIINDFLSRREGIRNAKAPHPLLSDILRETHGILIFWEQVVAVVVGLTGLSGIESCLLADRLVKGSDESRAAARATILDLATAPQKALSDGDVQAVLRVLERFGRKLPFRSHAHARAVVAYRQAWLRLHRTDHWIAGRLHYMARGEETRMRLARLPGALPLLREAGLA